MWIVDRQAEWSVNRKVNGANGYRIYVEEAVAAGLSAGGLWTSFKDWPHVQMRAIGSPERIMALKDVAAEMQRRFGP
jgi:hypothetical protein